MEELRSTQILDKEIFNDATRKVESIVKKTDNEYKNIVESVDTKIQQAKKEKEDFYNSKLASFENDQNASIPLENARFGISFVHNSITQKLNDYLEALSEDKRLELVFKNFNSERIADKKINAYVYGFDIAKVEKLLKQKLNNNLLSCTKTEFGKIVIEDDNTALKQGIILEAQDLSFRWRLSISEVVSKLMDEHRVELYNVLFGIGDKE